MTAAKPLDRPNLVRPVAAGASIVALFFGGFLGWAALAPLSSAAIATGTVVVDGQRKTVQHLEGGIVEAIEVREGARVEAGQVLVRLDGTHARASLGLLRARRMVARAIEARLVAERDGREAIAFPKPLLSLDGDTKVAEILRGQRNIFAARRDNLRVQTAILETRITEYDAEIRGIEGQIAAETTQLGLLDEQIETLRILTDKGLARKPRLLALMERRAQIEGSRNLHRAQIARARQSISEARIRIAELGTANLKDVVEQLRGVQAEIYDLDERLRAARDVLARTLIRAPATGTVVGLQVHTAGGVVRAGEPLMDVVPSGRELVVEARVAPGDIDVVRPGLSANVRFTALNQRNRMPLQGTVTSVSADRLTDAVTGEEYFLARIELGARAGEQLAGSPLQAGMQAEVMIVTGQRTTLAYLLEPVVNSLNRAFRES